MKIPEPLFVIVNPAMKLLLRSPFHIIVSRSVLLVTFKGRRSGKFFTTPLRYVKEGSTIRAFSSAQTSWWRNLRGGARVTLRLRGRDIQCEGRVLHVSVEEKAYLLQTYLSRFPQDAAYHDVALDRNKKPKESDIARAAEVTAIVEFKEV